MPYALASGLFAPGSRRREARSRTSSGTGLGYSGSFGLRRSLCTASPCIPLPGRTRSTGSTPLASWRTTTRPTSSCSASTGTSRSDDPENVRVRGGRIGRAAREPVLPLDVPAAKCCEQRCIPRDASAVAGPRDARRDGEPNGLQLAYATPRDGCVPAERSPSAGRLPPSDGCRTGSGPNLVPSARRSTFRHAARRGLRSGFRLPRGSRVGVVRLNGTSFGSARSRNGDDRPLGPPRSDRSGGAGREVGPGATAGGRRLRGSGRRGRGGARSR